MGISIGLVGLGSFGSGFADLLYRHPLVDRVALCDREPDRIEKFASRPDWKHKFHRRDAYDSMDAICRSDVDALVVITQPWLHAPQCLAALEAGKHVYSAVPIMWVPDGLEILEWCDKLVNAVKRTGRHYMLGETTYYRPEAMYCRRQFSAGAFGHVTYTEGEYFHGYDNPYCDLRDVQRSRTGSRSGQEWLAREAEYARRGIRTGPMHYPTHSIGGPISVTRARALKVCCWGYRPRTDDPFFKPDAFSNETALFQMSDGSTMRICEHRECSVNRETFRIYGTKGSYENGRWVTEKGPTELSDDAMRDPLPADVAQAWRGGDGKADLGGHGGSHAYLVDEFVQAVAANRTPAINIWEATRYMAAGVMAHQSALKDGEILSVPDWGDPPR